MERVSDRSDEAAAVEGGPLGMVSAPLTPELVTERLCEVIDPELGVNIVDLGLVYEVTVGEAGNVAIEMTLTTPGCPLGGMIDDEIRDSLAGLPAVRNVRIDLVWEPPWSPAAMSDAARRELGMA